MANDRVIDSQRPVWKEQWCARKDAVESSGGREDQFWANGVSEPLPPPSRSNQHIHNSHHANHVLSHRAPSPISYPSTSPVQAREGMEHATVLHTPSRRKVVSSTSLSRKKPQLARVPTPHALVSNRAPSRTTRSAGPYPSSSSRGNRKTYRSSRTAEGSPFFPQWGQSGGLPGSSSNLEHQQPFEESALFSRRSISYTPSMTTPHQTHGHHGYNPGSSWSPDGFSFPLPVTSRQTSPLSMMPLVDYSVPNAGSSVLEKMYDMEGSGQLGALFDAKDGIGPYDSPAFQGDYSSLLWSGDQSWQQPVHHMLMDPTAMLFQSPPITSDHVPGPVDALHHGFSLVQLPQPSPQQINAPLTNEHQTFDFNGHIYGSSNVAHTNQFNDIYFSHPSTGVTSLDSFPNIVEDEDGILYFEGQTDAPRADQL